MEMQVGRSIVLRALSVARHRTIVEEHGASRPARAAQLNYKWFCAALGNSKTSLLSTWKHIPARAHATRPRPRAGSPAARSAAPLFACTRTRNPSEPLRGYYNYCSAASSAWRCARQMLPACGVPTPSKFAIRRSGIIDQDRERCAAHTNASQSRAGWTGPSQMVSVARMCMISDQRYLRPGASLKSRGERI